jgi:general secretion pathway protein J
MRACAHAERGRGFTLIEAMVAMAIFAFIGVAAYSLLSSTGRLKESGEVRFRALSGLQLGMRQIDEDFSQFAARPVNGPGAKAAPALDASPEDAVVALTRAGWRNPLGVQRSGLQRVWWALDEDGRLLRRYRKDLDDLDPDETVERVFVEAVESFELRYMDEKGQWIEEWPPESGPGTAASAASAAPVSPAATDIGKEVPVPVAVEVRIKQSQIGEVLRVIPLR